MLINFLLVAVGGAVGASFRYGLSLWTASRFGVEFPYGTFVANVLGCFIIGFFMVAATERFGFDPRWRLLVATGFLGGLTTFSSYSYESLALLQSGAYFLTVLNIFGNLFFGFFACWGGMVLSRLL